MKMTNANDLLKKTEGLTNIASADLELEDFAGLPTIEDEEGFDGVPVGAVLVDVDGDLYDVKEDGAHWRVMDKLLADLRIDMGCGPYIALMEPAEDATPSFEVGDKVFVCKEPFATAPGGYVSPLFSGVVGRLARGKDGAGDYLVAVDDDLGLTQYVHEDCLTKVLIEAGTALRLKDSDQRDQKIMAARPGALATAVKPVIRGMDTYNGSDMVHVEWNKLDPRRANGRSFQNDGGYYASDFEVLDTMPVLAVIHPRSGVNKDFDGLVVERAERWLHPVVPRRDAAALDIGQPFCEFIWSPHSEVIDLPEPVVTEPEIVTVEPDEDDALADWERELLGYNDEPTPTFEVGDTVYVAAHAITKDGGPVQRDFLGKVATVVCTTGFMCETHGPKIEVEGVEWPQYVGAEWLEPHDPGDISGLDQVLRPVLTHESQLDRLLNDSVVHIDGSMYRPFRKIGGRWVGFEATERDFRPMLAASVANGQVSVAVVGTSKV